MAKIIIKCHAAPGFDAVWAAKRRWPANGTEVETVTGPDDIEPTPDDPVLKIGTQTIAEMEATGRFSFGISGTIEEIESIKAENAVLKARIAELEAAAAKDSGKKK